MHILASGSLVLVSGMIYRRGKTRSGAYIGLFFGAVAMIVTMVLWNLIFTPIFLNAPRSEVLPLLPLIAAFNAVKAGVNSIITALLYKTVSKSINAVIKEYETGRPGK
jgi:riboflavin transporter FmnP